MSRAYASTLEISFDVRGGLLVRQMHHWAAMLFIAAMFVHMMRVFVTGAFRKPREVTWMIGGSMLVLGIVEGFAGYSLPDDLLSGTGLRIADGIVKATPVVGTHLSFLLFDGEFPGDAIVSRLYIVHVLLIPGLLLALVAAHLLLVVFHKHTQWPGPGRSEGNVVGFPFLPVYVAKTTGFLFMVAGVTALMGGAAVDQPRVEIWALRRVKGDRGLAAGLIPGLRRGGPADHARLGATCSVTRSCGASCYPGRCCRWS
jgi:ubiquinol-cytochrome c reductase cytochrome b subunit